jgi:stage V sporulation protein D (sporulation-specific penicillin-binding protein)
MNSVDIATSSFGQGFQITPLQLITAISAVINGGERMKPHIVKEVRNSQGVVKSFEPQVVTRVISEQTSDKMRSILESVVSTPGATGKNAYVKGWRIGGKTATSEKMPRGTDARIASFIGFAPANDPEIICLIVFDEPQVSNKYGGTLAAPVVGELIDETLEYLGIDRQYSANEEPDKTFEVPDVRGMSLDEAEEAIVEAGFKYTIKGDRDIDEIETQLPKPGVVMSEKSLVVLYTEEKEETVTVPDLKGLSVSAARETLLIRNLNFEVAGAGHSNVSGAYAVNQSIKPNTKVSPGTVVGVEFRQAAID